MSFCTLGGPWGLGRKVANGKRVMKKRNIRKNLLLSVVLAALFLSPVEVLSTKSIFEWTQAGKKELENGKYQNSLNNFQKALTMNRSYLPALLGMGRCYSELGALKRALDIFNMALRLQIKKETVLSEIGNTYLRSGIFSEAMRYFQQARKIHKGFFPAEIGLARVFRLKGRYSQAQSMLMRLERKFPGRFDLYLEKFSLAVATGNYHEARQSLNRAENIRPNSIKIYLSGANLILERFFLGKGGDIGNKALLYLALEKLNIASKINRENQQAILLKGKIYLIQKQWNRADNIFDRLLKKNKEYSLLYYLSGFASEKKGNRKKALLNLNRAFEINDLNSVVRSHLENFLIERNFAVNHPLRRKLAKKRFKKSEFFYNKNLVERAFYELNRALKLDPNLFEAHERLLLHYKYQYLYPSYVKELKIILGLVDPLEKKRKNKYRFLLQKSIRERRNHLYFKEELKSPFKRNPFKIYLDEPKISMPHVVHFGIDNDFIKMIKFNLELNERFTWSEGRALLPSADYILKSKISEGLNYIETEIKLVHSLTGIVVDSVTLNESGEGALDRISSRLINQLDNKIPKIGEIIKIYPDYLIVNIGVPEKIKKGSTVYFYQMNRSSFLIDPPREGKGALARGKVAEVDGFISKIIPDKRVNVRGLSIGDLAVFDKSGSKKKNGKKSKT